jgi:hypothetical protein
MRVRRQGEEDHVLRKIVSSARKGRELQIGSLFRQLASLPFRPAGQTRQEADWEVCEGGATTASLPEFRAWHNLHTRVKGVANPLPRARLARRKRGERRRGEGVRAAGRLQRGGREHRTVASCSRR